ncbi:MAG: hypothetical protein Q9181_004156 [Wetmoreana brouardii]
MASVGTMTTRPTTSTTLAQRNSSPATPQATNPTLSQIPVATPSPGRWRHPQFDEITRRQKASTFDSSSAQRIIFNTILILALYLLQTSLTANPTTLSFLLSPSSQDYLCTSLFYATLLPIYNILIALLPLYTGADNIQDIPLTPSQRALLGLDPNATPPPTPGTQYVTPPRYARSPTPRNHNSPSSNRSSAGNKPPYSLHKERSSESPSYGGSPFSPSASPLLWSQKASFGSDSMLGLRRSSLGSPSPLGMGKSESLWSAPGTPSPLAGKGQGQGASVGLNSRWLYERGKGGSGRKVL